MSKNAQYEKLVDFLTARETWLTDQRDMVRLTIAHNANIVYSDVERMALIGGSAGPIAILRSLVDGVAEGSLTAAQAVKEAKSEAEANLLHNSPFGTSSIGYSLIIANTTAFWQEFSRHML